MAVVIQIKRGTAEDWASTNPILADGEKGLEKGTNKEKNGDGVTHWNDLPYFGGDSSLVLGETSTTAGRGDWTKTAYDHSQLTTGNPHGTTKVDLSLGNVDNTSDINKPVSTATQTAINNAVAGLYDDRGNYDASTNLFPSTGGSGGSGAILKGDIWLISVAGILGGTSVVQGDSVRALVDSPAQTSGNWAIGTHATALVYASQAEAEGNSDNVKVMPALRVFQNWLNNIKNYSNSGYNTTSKTTEGAINELKTSISAVSALLPNVIAFTTAIPFDNQLTDIADHTPTSNTVFTIDTTGAIDNGGAQVLVNNNVLYTPNLTAFHVNGFYDNTVAYSLLTFVRKRGKYIVSILNFN